MTLHPDRLCRLPPDVRVPTYDRRAVTPSIAHIGVGGFFRSHQALYLDDLLQTGHDMQWGYRGIGLLEHDVHMANALAPQDCLYTLVERSAVGDTARVIGSLLHYVHAPSDREAVLEHLASPETRIVSLTITEGGYYVSEATGEFADTHPDIVHDLANPHTPRCSFGVLAEALARRRARGLHPFTVMSCDNVQHNGAVARRTLLAFSERRDPALADWVARNVAFPNSMVDRITPVTTDAHRELVRTSFGIDDRWPVIAEPFSQWVVEDQFPSGRPAWERVGVQLTSDVLPYEKMKMRLLNASHQGMCYIGMLLGHTLAHEAMADRGIERLLERMMREEIAPLLSAPEGVDLEAYQATLIERFANPAIGDQLSRLGTEGSVRIPGFVLPSIVDALRSGGKFVLLAFTVAAWIRYLTGKDDDDADLPIIDPMAEQLTSAALRAGRDPAPVLALADVFAPELSSSEAFVQEVRRALTSFYDNGVRATLMEYVGL